MSHDASHAPYPAHHDHDHEHGHEHEHEHENGSLSAGSGSSGTATGSTAQAGGAHALADYLLDGYWQGRGGRRSFDKTDLTVNLEGLTASRAELARLALAAWEDASGLTFNEVSGSADISFTQTGWSTASTSSSMNWWGDITEATVNVSTNWAGGYDGVESYVYQTLLHEIGHALGLGHQGPYNGGATYGQDNVFADDSWAMSVMSYFDQEEAGAGSFSFVYTPQIADVLAIQELYGTSDVRSGNTIYGDNTNVAGMTARLLDPAQFEYEYSFTIVDAGGVDVLDRSSATAREVIDLREGGQSSIGGQTNNVSIAFGTIIENAYAGSGNDELHGNGAANILSGGAGNDLLIGYGGTDTAVIEMVSGAVQMIRTANGITARFGNQTDELISIENFAFDDGTWFHDVTSPIAAAFRMYAAAFDRTPDYIGLDGWADALTNGLGIAQMADAFAGSAEFEKTYGDLTDGQFIDQLYLNVLDRAADSAGRASWLDAMNSGRLDRGDVLAGFSESREHVEKLRDPVEAGLWDVDPLAASIARLYRAALERDPDAGGLMSWMDVVEGGSTLANVADGFAASAEFGVRYGQLSSSEFVEQLYENVLGRAADEPGREHWVGLLETGRLDRGDVLLGFSESREHQIRTVDLIDDGIDLF